MKFSPRAAGLAAAAAIALPLGLATPASAVDLTPCAADDLAGEWTVLYQIRKPEYCVLSVDAAGDITASACHGHKKKPLRETITGTLAVDAACAVTGALDFSRYKGSEASGKGKYGAFDVEVQLSEDRSTMVGVFKFRKSLAHAVGQRTQ